MFSVEIDDASVLSTYPSTTPDGRRYRTVKVCGRTQRVFWAATAEYKRSEFIKGPIRLSWLRPLLRLPRRAIRLGLYLQMLAGCLRRRERLRANLSKAQDFELSRQAASRALVDLERAGLISVERAPGRAPLVTILEVQP
jgi:hypothetical protein